MQTLEPIRIQRKRNKGWKMPANTVYVGRPSRWGNPWSADHHTGKRHHGDLPCIETTDYASTPEEAVKKFRKWIGEVPSYRKHQIFKYLKGRNLACWCALNKPCHADVLLEIANS